MTGHTPRTFGEGAPGKPVVIGSPIDTFKGFQPFGWYWPEAGSKTTIHPDGTVEIRYAVGGGFV